MNLDLTDEQKLISETARDFVDKEVVDRARENDRAEKFDRELASKLGEMGYLGAPDLAALRQKARYIQVTPAAQRESAPHDIVEVKTGN